MTKQNKLPFLIDRYLLSSSFSFSLLPVLCQTAVPLHSRIMCICNVNPLVMGIVTHSYFPTRFVLPNLSFRKYRPGLFHYLPITNGVKLE